METDNRRAWGKGKNGDYFLMNTASVWGDEIVLEMHSGGGGSTTM